MNKNYYIATIVFIAILVQSRLIVHPWNFTPVIAAGVFAGFYFRQLFLASFVIILSMFIGDLYLGFHNTMLFTYIGLGIAVAIGMLIKSFKFLEIIITGLVSSLAFFLITNFGAWMTLEMYDKNIAGLISSYVLAIPFFHNTLISTLLYLFLFKLIFDWIFNKKIITKQSG